MWMSEGLKLKKRSKVYRIFNSLLKCPYVLIAPVILLCLVLTIYPIIYGTYISFFKWNLLNDKMTFVGFNNYRYLFESKDFIKILKNTVIFMFVSVFAGIALKVILGVFLNKRTIAHNVVQTVMFTPHIISSVSVAVIFMWLMDPMNGIFNYFLGLFGLPTSMWYRGTDSALASVLIVSIWKSVGYGVLLVIAGLRSIPTYIYEAARLDKSGTVKTFFKITLPLLSPTLLYMTVTTTVGSFTTFDVIKLMSDGGPDNATNLIAYFIYQQGFRYLNYGRAMAAAIILFIFTSILALINFLFLSKKVHYQ